MQEPSEDLTYERLVLVELVDLLRSSLEQLLDDLRPVDGREEVPPRVVRDELNFLVRGRAGVLVTCPASEPSACDKSRRRYGERILGSVLLRVAREVDVAVAEEAARDDGRSAASRAVSLGFESRCRDSRGTYFLSAMSVLALTMSTGSGYWNVLTITTGQFIVTRSWLICWNLRMSAYRNETVQHQKMLS